MASAVGFEFDPIPVAWLQRDLLLFANSIGVNRDELHFLYELHPNFQAFPTYPIVLSFKHKDQEVIDFIARMTSGAKTIPGVPKLDPGRTLDGQRQLTVLQPIPTSSVGREFELRGKCLGVYDKGKAGTVTETEHLLVDKATGEAYTKIVSSSFAVGQGGWGGPKGPKTENFPPPEGKAPDATFAQPTSPEIALLYRLNGDYNPLHADPTVGKKIGYKGAILHGLGTWNMAAHAVLKTFGNSDPTRLRLFQARFASAVMPGDGLVFDMWRTGKKEDGFDEIIFVAKVKEGGRVVLSNGRALVKVDAGGSTSKL
ncbi:peroxisomal dehydratase [Choiromyces venosus 120613-1]|uniref:Peroxisomal dehydratase n=1 Tax=Choiromyces venosus 120613-1 TaxID=1336337 RepID=A0A3N4J6Q7_9PEZI|nr:peroxisomal dehydratase [Choiromyces venosus 120613-1]